MHSFRIPEASTHSIQNLVHRGVSSIAKNIIFIQQIPPPQYSTAPTFNHGFSPERVFHMYSHLENSSKLEIPSSHHLFYIIMHHHTLLFKHQVPIIPFHICKQSFIIPLFKHLVTGKSGKSSHPPHPPLPNREPCKVLKRCAAQVEVDVEHLVDTVRHNFTADKRQGSWDLMIWWRKVRISDDLGDYVWCLMIWSWAHVYSLYARLFYHAGKRHQTWHRVRKCRNRSHGWHLTTFN